MLQEELGRNGNPVHPDEDPASEARQYRSKGSGAESRILGVNSFLEHELVEGVHEC